MSAPTTDGNDAAVVLNLRSVERMNRTHRHIVADLAARAKNAGAGTTVTYAVPTFSRDEIGKLRAKLYRGL